MSTTVILGILGLAAIGIVRRNFDTRPNIDTPLPSVHIDTIRSHFVDGEKNIQNFDRKAYPVYVTESCSNHPGSFM